MGIYIKTPTLAVNDPRGLAILSVSYWRAEDAQPVERRRERTLRDAAGRAIRHWDARLWALQEDDLHTPSSLGTVYSLNDNVLRSDSNDAGKQVELLGLAGEVVLGWDSRDTRREVEYDDLLRAVAVYEVGAGESRRCIERLTYGRAGVDERARNQSGQLIRHDDPAGSVLLDSFAITGQCIANTRRFTRDPVSPDWPLAEEEREHLLEPGEGAISRWRFTALGQMSEQIDARGNRQTFELTLDGRLRAAHAQLKNQPDSQPMVSDVRYNADGQVEHELAGNGVRTTLAYRPEDGRLTSRSASSTRGQLLQQLSYDYDPMGNVLSIEDKAQPIRYFANQRIEPISRFTYDSLYQLSRASGWEAGAVSQGPASAGRADPAAFGNYRQTYRYDAGGNLLELTHVGVQTHGRKLETARYSNRALPWRNDMPPSEEQIAAAFDPRGNLLELDQGRWVRWNLRNQLQSVSPVVRASDSSDQETYLYDARGRRVRKIRALQTRARTVISEVRYLPGLELRTDSGTGEVLQVIAAQPGLNSVNALHWETSPPPGGNDRYRYTVTDHLGSASLELGEDARIISQETYYPFGETAWSREAEVSYRTVRYSGKERDATGLDYYGYRYYIPWLQRWSNPDPAGVGADGSNLFRMVRNNPLTFFDEQGEESKSNSAVRTAVEIFESYKGNYNDTDRVKPYTMMNEITEGRLKFKAAKASTMVLEKTKELKFTMRHYSYNFETKGAAPSHMDIKSNFSLVNSKLKALGGKGGNTSEKDWTKAGNMGFTFFLLSINGEVNERRFLAGMTHFAEYDLEDDDALKNAFGDSYDNLEFFASPDVLDPKHSSDLSAVPMIKGRLKELKALMLGSSGISPVQVGRMNARAMLDSLDNSFHGTLEIKIPGSVKVSTWHKKVQAGISRAA
ncbi:RHS repeat domain-containing protein [Pseudomonas koreensis]|uniref:Rhs n=1 Tax=Pseudomonas koreensis TaxID=198620 RepID=A0AA94EM99_9PSED|nr:RHS repeat-associated core domain-containing protein [Pseudomonas koreensis]RVD76168.1 Rhs [Pseudomonas koreensis]